MYYFVNYDNEASGPFTEEGANLTWPGGTGFLVTLIDDGATGKMYFALVSGDAPTDGETITQGGTTADADGDAILIAYPAYFRKDVSILANGNMAWTGPALETTHSFFFDGQTSNIVAGEILTFSGGQTCEVVTVESDAGASGELSVRFISNIDEGLPSDNDTFTGDQGGDGTLDGIVHPRSYQPLELHRLLQDLNDNSNISGDDDLSRIDPIASSKDTDQIVNLLGTVNVTDEIIQHMYGGSISQDSGNTLYAGLAVQVTSSNTDTQPILIKNDSQITNYWKNALNPDSIKGNIRIMTKVREDGVSFDGGRIKGKLAEFGDSYFVGSTTIDVGETALALFASPDGNNQTAEGTVAGAPYNTIVQTEGYQTIDYSNGNGPQPYAYSIDFGSASSLQTYERTKYIGRRGTAETLFGRNAVFFDGINLNFAYDGESANFQEDEVLYWGTVMTYSGQTVNLTVGEVVTFSGGSRGRLIYMNDGGATGTLIFDMDGNTLPATSETMTGVDSAGDGTIDTVGTNTIAGSGTLCALDDQGTTGNMYLSRLTGLVPVDNSEIYGGTSNSDCLVNTTIETRTINNQYWGVYTGTNHQTNFGLGLNATDGIVGDIFPDLDGGSQSPPNNQTGQISGLKEGDTVTCYPWDGSSVDTNGDPQPDFDEATVATTALTGGVSTTIEVSSIPDNTPNAGFLRVERDSDGNYDLVEYVSFSGSTYTLGGSTPTAPNNAAISNNVMRAFIDQEMTADGTASYTAVKGAGNTQVVNKVQNGYTSAKNGPIKPSVTTATFGTNGFSAGASRISDA